MAVSVTCTAANTVDNKIHVAFGNRVFEFDGKQGIREFINRVVTEDTAIAFALAKAMQLDNPSAAIGKTLTIDLSLARNIVQVT